MARSWFTLVGLGVVSLGIAGAGAYYLVRRRRNCSETCVNQDNNVETVTEMDNDEVVVSDGDPFEM